MYLKQEKLKRKGLLYKVMLLICILRRNGAEIKFTFKFETFVQLKKKAISQYLAICLTNRLNE